MTHAFSSVAAVPSTLDDWVADAVDDEAEAEGAEDESQAREQGSCSGCCSTRRRGLPTRVAGPAAFAGARTRLADCRQLRTAAATRSAMRGVGAWVAVDEFVPPPAQRQCRSQASCDSDSHKSSNGACYDWPPCTCAPGCGLRVGGCGRRHVAGNERHRLHCACQRQAMAFVSLGRRWG